MTILPQTRLMDGLLMIWQSTLNAQECLLSYRPILSKKNPSYLKEILGLLFTLSLDYKTKRRTSLNAAETNVRKRPASPPLTAR